MSLPSEPPAEVRQPIPLQGVELTASLTVRDLDSSLRFYVDLLGFEVARSFERDGTTWGASLRAGAVRILLTRDDGSRGTDRPKGEGFSLMIVVEQDVDDLGGTLVRNGWTLDTPPFDSPSGGRALRVRDPDGFRITVSSSR